MGWGSVNGGEKFGFRAPVGVYGGGMKRLILTSIVCAVAGALGMRAWIYKRAPWMNDGVAADVVWKEVATGPGQIPILSDGRGRLYRVYVNTKDGGAEWGLVALPVRE